MTLFRSSTGPPYPISSKFPEGNKNRGERASVRLCKRDETYRKIRTNRNLRQRARSFGFLFGICSEKAVTILRSGRFLTRFGSTVVNINGNKIYTERQIIEEQTRERHKRTTPTRYDWTHPASIPPQVARLSAFSARRLSRMQIADATLLRRDRITISPSFPLAGAAVYARFLRRGGSMRKRSCV